MPSSAPQTPEQELELLHQRLGALFRRSEPRQRCLAYLKGLLSPIERKNSWQLALWMGESTPDGVQHLLERANWDADAARDLLRDYVAERLAGREAVLMVGETGFVKKGTHSAGVQRQYCGPAGRKENRQVGVFLCCAGAGGASAFIDRQLYIPREWCADRARCRRAAIPDELGYTGKPQIARQLLERALAAGVHCAWVAGDESCGAGHGLRDWLQERAQPYLLAVSADEPLRWQGPQPLAAREIAQALKPQAWKRLPADPGAAGSEGEDGGQCDWALTPLWQPPQAPGDQPPQRGDGGDGGDEGNEGASGTEEEWGQYLLLRRAIDGTGAPDCHLVYAPKSRARLARLLPVAAQRARMEAAFEAAKTGCGLDHYEVRRLHGWYRHVTLALIAHAVLAVQRGRQKKRAAG